MSKERGWAWKEQNKRRVHKVKCDKCHYRKIGVLKMRQLDENWNWVYTLRCANCRERGTTERAMVDRTRDREMDYNLRTRGLL